MAYDFENNLHDSPRVGEILMNVDNISAHRVFATLRHHITARERRALHIEKVS